MQVPPTPPTFQTPPPGQYQFAARFSTPAVAPYALPPMDPTPSPSSSNIPNGNCHTLQAGHIPRMLLALKVTQQMPLGVIFMALGAMTLRSAANFVHWVLPQWLWLQQQLKCTPQNGSQYFYPVPLGYQFPTNHDPRQFPYRTSNIHPDVVSFPAPDHGANNPISAPVHHTCISKNSDALCDISTNEEVNNYSNYPARSNLKWLINSGCYASHIGASQHFSTSAPHDSTLLQMDLFLPYTTLAIRTSKISIFRCQSANWL